MARGPPPEGRGARGSKKGTQKSLKKRKNAYAMGRSGRFSSTGVLKDLPLLGRYFKGALSK